MNRDAEQRDDVPLAGLTVQPYASFEDLQARLIGALEVDASTNCQVVRIAVGTGDRLVDIDVAWPLGWSVAVRDGKPALIGATGELAGLVGDEVSVGGGSVDTATTDVISCNGQDWVFKASGLRVLRTGLE